MTQLDLLEDIRQSLSDAQKNGMNLKQWSEIAEQKMKAKGWWGKYQIQTEAGTRGSVLENIAFGLKMKGVAQAERLQLARHSDDSTVCDPRY